LNESNRPALRGRVVVATLLGLLVGAACSNGVPTVAADAVAALMAADIGYDNAAAGLAATDVQAALDALAEQLGTLPNVAAVGGLVDVATAPLAARLDALEAGVSAESVSLADVEGATNVGAALVLILERLADVEQIGASQQARILALESQVEALSLVDESLTSQQAATQAQLEGLGDCPEGFGDIGSACMEPNDRPPHNFHGSVGSCLADGMHLCSAVEHLAACAGAVLVVIPEAKWTASVLGEATVLGAEGSSCTFANYFVPLTNLTTGRSFRCCYTK
jgi:hypothetical protein